MAQIYLSIGSNIEAELHFQRCATELDKHFTHLIWSPVYRSPAVGMVGDDFLNAVVCASTDKSVDAIVNLLRQIEHALGRTRSVDKFTSRTIDIDLLLYDDLVIETEDVTLPQAELITEAYVLVPFVDIAPDVVHPILNKDYQNILAELERQHAGFRSKLAVVKLDVG